MLNLIAEATDRKPIPKMLCAQIGLHPHLLADAQSFQGLFIVFLFGRAGAASPPFTTTVPNTPFYNL